MQRSLNSTWFKAVAVLLAVMVVSVPLMAQQMETDACAAAKAAAERDTNSTLWFLAGCLGGALGVIIAYVYAPSPPATALVGKPPTYVATYTDCYKAAAKKIQQKKAVTGCLVATAADLMYFAVALATATSE